MEASTESIYIMESANKTSSCGISMSQALFYVNYSWWISGVGTICVASLGVIFNTMAIFILCDKRMRSSFFNRLLVCLAIADNVFLANAISVVVVEQLIDVSSGDHLFMFVHLLYPTRNMLMCTSIYMTVGLACERFNSTSNPYLHRTRQNGTTCHRLLLYILPVITFSILYNIPKFFDLEVAEKLENCLEDGIPNDNSTAQSSNCTTYMIIQPTDIRNNDDYILWYINISNLVVTAVIPLVLLTYFNYKIYTSLKQRQVRKAVMVSQQNSSTAKEKSKKEVRQTFVLFAIVALFVICHALRVILNVEEFANLEKNNEQEKKGCVGKEFWTVILIPIAALLLQINSGTNFFVYCVLSDMFRDVLKSKLIKTHHSQPNSSPPQTKSTPMLNKSENIELQEIN